MRRKTTIRIMIAISAVLMCFFAIGCQKSSEEVIRDSIVARFEPYRTMSDDVISRLSKSAENESLPEMGIGADEFARALLQDFDYTIGKISVEEKSARAEVTLKSKSLSDLQSRLSSSTPEFERLSSKILPQDYKMDVIHEIIMRDIQQTDINESSIELVFSLEGTEWTSKNATEELGKIDSVLFSS